MEENTSWHADRWHQIWQGTSAPNLDTSGLGSGRFISMVVAL